MGYSKSKSVVISSQANMLLIKPIIALFTRSLSQIQTPSGWKDPAGFYSKVERWLGEGTAMVSCPRFDDWVSGRVT